MRRDEAVPHLDAAFAAGVYRDYVAFYQAVCAAETGHLEKAGEALQQAFELGFEEGDRLKRHSALDALKDHPAYQTLIERSH